MQASRTDVDYYSYGRFYKLDSELDSEQAFFDFSDEYKFWMKEYEFYDTDSFYELELLQEEDRNT